MQCSESVKPVKTVWNEVKLTMKVKLDFVNVIKLPQNVNKYFGMQTAVEFSPTWTILCRHFQAVASI